MPDGVCLRCASNRGARGVCRGCRQLSPMLSAIQAAFVYEGAARNAVLTLKFRSGRFLVPLMGELLGEALAARPLEADVVVPVPLTRQRLRSRGFNQATLLAEHVAATLNATIASTNVLSREERPPQQTLGAAERLVNLEGAISCTRPEDVRGRRVLIVDDVVTTGATVSACADTLARAGARRISVLAFARDL
jgi:ComF family protein